jgi:hypothetical protein
LGIPGPTVLKHFGIPGPTVLKPFGIPGLTVLKPFGEHDITVIKLSDYICCTNKKNVSKSIKTL